MPKYHNNRQIIREDTRHCEKKKLDFLMIKHLMIEYLASVYPFQHPRAVRVREASVKKFPEKRPSGKKTTGKKKDNQPNHEAS